MGRPSPSNVVREFSAEFARTVTDSSHRRHDWVARIGRYSIFSLLSTLANKVFMSLIEFENVSHFEMAGMHHK